MPSQKYFVPSVYSVEGALRELSEEYPDVYFGSFAVARKVDIELAGIAIAKKYVEPVLKKLADDGRIERVEIQLGLLPASRRLTAYRAKR